MKSAWRSLLWKEWREHRWTLAALSAIATLAPLGLALGTRGFAIFDAVLFTLTLLVPLAAMFIGMYAAAGEQSRGTIRFLQALPIRQTRPAGFKLLMACATVAAPVVAGLLLAGVWNTYITPQLNAAGLPSFQEGFGHSWGIGNWYAAILISGVVGGWSILIWMVAAGVNRSDEVRAGAVGLLVVLTIWAALTLPLTMGDRGSFGYHWAPPTWYRIGSAAAPGGPATISGPSNRTATTSWWLEFGPPLVAAALSHVFVAAWYLWRFGRTPPSRPQPVGRQPATVPPAWLPPPRRSPLTAIAWKQARETAPMALLSAGIVVLAGTWAAVTNRGGDLAHNVASITSGVWLAIGMFVAIVAGIGTFMDDLRPGLNGFWRSRPINVNQWFAVKFSLALLTTLAILVIPPVAVTAYFWTPLADASISRAHQLSNVKMGLVIQAGLFTAAVAAMTLVRQAIYAAVLTIAIALTVIAGIELMAPALKPDLQPLLALVAFGSPMLACVALAWAAVRNDWGWKG